MTLHSNRFSSLILGGLMLTALPFQGNANTLHNGSFEHGNTLADALLWHRMTGSPASVTEIESGWNIDDQTAWHGSRSLRGNGQTPLVFCAEVWKSLPSKKSPWVFSVYLKADRPGVKCELATGLYTRFSENQMTKVVELDTEWRRYEIVVDRLGPSTGRRGGPLQGPVNFVVRPLQNATVWVDSLQWESGSRAKDYQELESTITQENAPSLVFQPTQSQERSSEGTSSWQGVIPLRVYREGTAGQSRQPVTIAIPFNQGAWNGLGQISLVNGNGLPVAVQSEVLTRWPEDQSIRSLLLFFTDELKEGWQDYQLNIGGTLQQQDVSPTPEWIVHKSETPGMLWQQITNKENIPLFGPSSLRAIGMDGTVYDSRWDSDAEWVTERTGKLFQTSRISGRLVSQDGQALLAFTARIHVWRDLPGVKLELSVINSRNTDSIPVQSLYWYTDGSDNITEIIAGEGNPHSAATDTELTSLYIPDTDRFLQRISNGNQVRDVEGRHLLYLQANTANHHLLLHAPEAWQRHPAAIAWKGHQLRGYLWPDQPVRSLLFPKGLALTREFWLRQTDNSPSSQELLAWDQDPIGIAAPHWWATTNIIIPFAASDPERLPFIEDILGGTRLLGRISQDSVESKRAYGVFDFGDNHGDGGWGNLESFNDWSALLSGLRSGNEEALRIGLRAARHYRDTDMNQMTGECYIHSLNHIIDVTSFSHAWPEGVMVHYLLTGSKRSYELILLHGEYLLAMDPHDPSLISGTRNLSRYLTNAVNLYELTGDSRYHDRFFAQLEIARQALEADVHNPDRSIFSSVGNSDNRRLVPFHAWYGIIALQKMLSLTGNQDLQQWINQELTATLNPELYYLDLLELWPGVPPEEGMPIIAADFARHRGSFYYPGLVAAAAANNDPKLAQLALQTLYCWAVEGISTTQIQAIVSSPPLNVIPEGATERDLIRSAADLLWRAAAPTLLNGDFSMSPNYWHHWRPFPGKSLSHHTNWQRRRQQMATLDSNVVHNGERSLRLNLDYSASVSVDTHRFQLEKGKHLLTGWIRWDEDALPPQMDLQIRNLKGRYQVVSVNLSTPTPTVSETSALRFTSATLSDPDSNGWRKLSLELDASSRLVANLRFVANRKKSSEPRGYVWIDDFALTKPID